MNSGSAGDTSAVLALEVAPRLPVPGSSRSLGVQEGVDIQRRFAGMDRLYGVEGAARVRKARVAVVGIGGVGSWTAEALARSGIGRLVLVDMDHVAESNVNRQIHALTSTVGQSKVQAMHDRIVQINPSCQVDMVDDFVTPANWPALVCGDVDAVVDACDQVQAKTAMADWARSRRSGAAFVTVGAAGGKRWAHEVDLDDLSRTTHDPLLAQVRYRLRKQFGAPRDGKAMGIECVFSREPVSPPDASCAVGEEGGDGSLNCHGYGSAVSVTATFGMVAAGRIIERLAKAAVKR